MNASTLLRVAFLMVFTASFAFAEPVSEDDATAIVQEVEAMVKAFHAGDSSKLLDKTHESLFEASGGKEKLAKDFDEGLKKIKAAGLKFVGFKVSPPTEMYTAGDQVVCFVPQATQIEIGGKQLERSGYLVAIRPKAGGEWKYLEGSGLDADRLAKLVPGLPKDAKIPANKVKPLVKNK